MTVDKALLLILLISLFLGVPLVIAALYRLYKVVR